MKLAGIHVVVLDLKVMIRAGTVPSVDGSLGYTSFHDLTLSLDAPHRRLGLTRPASGPCKGAAVSLITFGKKGPPIVTTTGFAVKGKPIVVQLDTLFAGTLLLYPEAEAALGFREPDRSLSPERFPFTDDGVTMMRGAATSTAFMGVDLGAVPVYFATKGVHLPDGLFGGTVGWGADADRHRRNRFPQPVLQLQPNRLIAAPSSFRNAPLIRSQRTGTPRWWPGRRHG